MDMITLAAARKYVADTANALGAVKGSPCTITSITEADDGIHIVFSWTGTDGTVATQTAIMPYVAVDRVAREAVETLREDMGEAIDTTVRSINGRKPDSVGNVALPLSVTGVPNTGSPHQVFVTDATGKPGWEDRTHYSEIVENAKLLSSEPMSIGISVDGISTVLMAVNSFPPHDMIDGCEYTLTFDKWDSQYTSKAVLLGHQNGRGVYVLGNLGIAGLYFSSNEPEDFEPVENAIVNPDPNAQYCLLYSSGEIYFNESVIFCANDTPAYTGTMHLTLSGCYEEIHKINSKYLDLKPTVVVGYPGDWSYGMGRLLSTGASVGELELAIHTGNMAALCDSTGEVYWYADTGNVDGLACMLFSNAATTYEGVSGMPARKLRTFAVATEGEMRGGVLQKSVNLVDVETDQTINGKKKFNDLVIGEYGTLTLQSGATVNDEAGVLGGGVKTAIFRSNRYLDILNGVGIDEWTPDDEPETFECVNMTYEEAKAALQTGEALNGIIQYTVTSTFDGSNTGYRTRSKNSVIWGWTLETEYGATAEHIWFEFEPFIFWSELGVTTTEPTLPK